MKYKIRMTVSSVNLQLLRSDFTDCCYKEETLLRGQPGSGVALLRLIHLLCSTADKTLNICKTLHSAFIHILHNIPHFLGWIEVLLWAPLCNFLPLYSHCVHLDE